MIKLLDQSVANKIAAGEVVERPASIVKELVENSIDAGSTSITVEIANGGVSYIRVTDNGVGIEAAEAETAFLRHATSKIDSEDDLYNIVTLGFRGEALASIAAVAKVQLLTRTRNSDFGTELLINGGITERVGAAGCPEGTNFIVRDLFYNTPARKKFLKKPSSEAGYIGDLVSRLILAYPAISFKYICDQKTSFHSPGDGNMLSALRCVYGKNAAENSIPVDFAKEEIRIFGYIGNRDIQKPNRTYQSLFVNDRYIKSNLISAAVAAAYEGRLNVGKFPFFVLRIDLPPAFVDVNVHPNKMEVRFADGLPMYSLVHQAVHETLQRVQEVPKLFTDIPEAIQTEIQKQLQITNEFPKETEEKKSDIGHSTLIGNVSKMMDSGGINLLHDIYRADIEKKVEDQHQPISVPAQEQMQELQIEESYKNLGQLFTTYIIIENGADAYIIDQHAAHERLLYERLYAQMNKDAVVSQNLLLPQVFTVNHQEYRMIEELLPLLQELGYDIDPIGGLSFGIKAVPLVLGQNDTVGMLTNLLEESEGIKHYRTADLKREKLMQMACKSAVKAGDSLTDAEVAELMKLIKNENVPLSCPHGRPILIKLSQRELELRFKRIMQ